MKNFQAILFTVLMALAPLTALHAQTIITDSQGLNYNILSQPSGSQPGTCEIGDNTSFVGDAVIPYSVTNNDKEYVVTQIADYAFAGSGYHENTSLTSIDFSGCTKLNTIGYAAFSYCEALTSIDLSECTALNTIGGNAFFWCYDLRSIDLSGCTTLNTIGVAAFFFCNALTSIDLSGCTKLNTIGGLAFSNCTNLTSIDLSGCTALNTIGGSAFSYCTHLTSIDLSGCTALNTIDGEAFSYCDALNSIDLSDCTRLTSIGERTFYFCEKLTSVILPLSLLDIGDRVFRGCSKLTSVTCYAETPPVFIEFFESDNFLFSSTMTVSGTLYVPAGSVDAYWNDPYWGKAANIVAIGSSGLDDAFFHNGIKYNILTEPSGSQPGTCEVGNNASFVGHAVIPYSVTYKGKEYIVTQITKSAFRYYDFSDNTGLLSIDLSDCTPLTSIGDDAFLLCPALKTFTISSLEWWRNVELKSLNSNPMNYGHADLYAGGQKVTHVTIPEGRSALDYHLYGCGSLESIDFAAPQDITSIEECAFAGCTALTSIDLSDCINLKTIGSRAFSGCSALTSIDLFNCTQLQSIGSWAFSGCSALTSIDLSNCKDLHSIGRETFRYCYSITSIDLSGCTALQSIETFAFNECTSLTSIDLSDCTALTSIGDYAFFSCISLTYIDLSECTALNTIGGNAFAFCYALTSIDLSNCTKLTSIGYETFDCCTKLTSAILPESLIYIGYRAFYGCYKLTSVTCYAETPPIFLENPNNQYNDNDLFSSPMTTSGTLYVPAGSVEAYRNDPYWGEAANIVAIGTSAVDDVFTDGTFDNGPVDVYDLSGRLVKRQALEDELQDLRPGIYIFRQGNTSKKILIQ